MFLILLPIFAAGKKLCANVEPERGDKHEEEAAGLMAVCLQHEIDQLDGIFWIRRLSRLKRERAIKRFEKLD